MSANPHSKYTDEEYLAIDRASEYKHELIDGEIVAMTGASTRHNLIAMSAGANLYRRLSKGRCTLFPSDMRLRIRRGLYAYPDLTVVCGKADIVKDQYKDTLLNPTVTIEILSKSTEAYDRGKKMQYYRSIPSLQAVLLISQNEPQVEYHQRNAAAEWVVRDFEGEEGVCPLEVLGIELPLAEIYERVDFDEREE
jgi:Uma2 family endonuclease